MTSDERMKVGKPSMTSCSSTSVTVTTTALDGPDVQHDLAWHVCVRASVHRYAFFDLKLAITVAETPYLVTVYWVCVAAVVLWLMISNLLFYSLATQVQPWANHAIFLTY